MKKIILINLILAILIMNFQIGYCAFSKKDIGTKGAQFLKIPVGVREIGMGSAGTAESSDVNTIYWNPAGLNYIEEKQVSFMHYVWFEDITYQSVLYAQPTEYGTFGIMINCLTMKGIEKYNNQGDDLNSTFKPSDKAFALSYANNFFGIPLGLNLKYISSKIDTESASALALDLGTKIFQLDDDRLALGFCLQNLGTSMVYIKEKTELPLTVKAGASYLFDRGDYDSVIVSADINAPIDNSIGLNLGAEYNYSISEDITFSPRAGYKINSNRLDGLSNMSLGTGFNFKNWRLDYAWTPYGELGITHQISVLFKFDTFVE
jgi:hypothetical protein